jgi:hypothetical protein
MKHVLFPAKQKICLQKQKVLYIFFGTVRSPQVSVVLIPFLNRHITFEVTKRNYLFGISNDNNFSEPLALVFDILKYVFWQLKLRGRLPNRHNVECEFNYLLGLVLNSNKKLKGQVVTCLGDMENKKDGKGTENPGTPGTPTRDEIPIGTADDPDETRMEVEGAMTPSNVLTRSWTKTTRRQRRQSTTLLSGKNL